MIRETVSADELFSKAFAVGQYYGFTPLSSLTHAVRGASKTPFPETIATLPLDETAQTVVAFLKQCKNAQCAPSVKQPLFAWHTNIAPGRPAQKRVTVQFHALGSDRAIAEAVVIRALLALTRDLFHEEAVVRINTMGDRETRARYARELAHFFKKRADQLPEECVARAKEDVFAAAELAILRECADDMPAPTEYLSDASRKRFEDLLEYLEMTETPYELSRTLMSRGSVWNDTCFEINVGGRRVAWGSRYNDLVKHFYPTGSFAATGAVFSVGGTGAAKPKKLSYKPRFSFIHIGDEAKRLSIRLAEDFKRAHIPLAQDIGVESLTEQIHLAERRGSPYLLIMGRKEALEGSVILRDVRTQDQRLLPLMNLTERLKSFA